MLAISSSRSPCRPAASAWPSLPTSSSDGISAGSTHSADSPATLTRGGGSGRSPACQCTLASRGLARYPPSRPALTRAEIIPRTRSPSPAVGAALTIACVCPVLMSWQMTAPMTGAANRSHSRRWVCACLRDHRRSNGEAVRGQVIRDQVRARPLHVGRVGLQPLVDLLQLGGQLLLGRRLALLPLAVLVPDGPPAAPPPPGRVHRDPALQLDHRARRPGWPRVRSRSPRTLPGAVRLAFAWPGGRRAAGRLWGFCGDLGPRGRCLRHERSLSSCDYRR